MILALMITFLICVIKFKPFKAKTGYHMAIFTHSMFIIFLCILLLLYIFENRIIKFDGEIEK